MGACVSSPESCVGGKLKYPKNKFRKRRKIKRRAVSRFADVTSFDKADRPSRPGPPPDRSFTNPTFRGLCLSLPSYLFKCICPCFCGFLLLFICGLNWNYGWGQLLPRHCCRALI